MKRLPVSFLIIIVLSAWSIPTFAQSIGDSTTFGTTDQRTFLNSDAGNFAPPLTLVRTLNLADVTAPESMVIFGNRVLVSEGGVNSTYSMFDSVSGVLQWRNVFPGSGGPLNFVPAVGNSVVLLAEAGTTALGAYSVANGQQIWRDDSVGTVQGRHPIVANQHTFYLGNSAVVAASSMTGDVFWRNDTTTSASAISTFGSQLYILESAGILRALNALDGSTLWTATNVGNAGAQIIAGGDFVFIADRSTGALTALRASDGQLVWDMTLQNLGRPAAALAYGQLIAFHQIDGNAAVSALNPRNGELLWRKVDPGTTAATAAFGAVANNMIYFYNTGTGRIRAIDAFGGTLAWSASQPGVLGLSVSGRALYVLLSGSIEVYAPVEELYFAQMADGLGTSTLFTVINLSPVPANTQIEFFDDSGSPLPVEVEGVAGLVTSVEFGIEAARSKKVQTLGTSAFATGGWARLTSTQPTRGTAVFQYSTEGTVLYEAGVADSPPTDEGRLFVSRSLDATGALLDTGIAIANPGDETANVRVTYRRRVPSESTFIANLTLDPGTHIARFLGEFFPVAAAPNTEGTLIVTSNVPVVMTALRTKNGYQMSSYPIGTGTN